MRSPLAGSIFACWIGLVAPHVVRGDVPFGADTRIVFATVEEGRAALRQRDEYLQRLSPLDLAVRLRTAKDVTIDDYLAVVERAVRPWDEEEKARLTKILESMQERGRRYARRLPKRVLLVKSSGADESDAAYTRGDVIVLTQARLKDGDAGTEKLLWHELFHVLSRHNPELRDRLYGTIGFQRCGAVKLPPDVADRKVTNPDAPHHEHAIRIQADGKPEWALPVLLSTRGRAQAGDGGAFFQFIDVKLLLVDRDPQAGTARAQTVDGKSRLIDLKDAPDFFAQIGRNTGYIIHAEEIMADNFALAARESVEVPSPELLAQIREILLTDGAAAR